MAYSYKYDSFSHINEENKISSYKRCFALFQDLSLKILMFKKHLMSLTDELMYHLLILFNPKT